jgi:hypothetical protein
MNKKLIFALISCSFLASIFIHLPGNFSSDTVFIFIRQTSSGRLLAPYFQSFFEYPVLTALVFYISARLGMMLPKALLSYYLINSSILFVFALGIAHQLTQILEKIGVKLIKSLVVFFIFAPSFIFYATYNWYLIGTFFCLCSLKCFLDGKHTKSGAFMGLSFSSNFITATPLIALLINSKEKMKILKGFVWGFLIVNLPVLLLTPKGWVTQFTYHINWYIEDSWLLLIPYFNSHIFSPWAKPISIIVTLSLIFLVFRFKKKFDVVDDSWLVQACVLFGSYIYAPQLNICILPLFSLIYLNPTMIDFFLFLAFDLCNVGIMLNWFDSPNSMVLPAPSQILSIERCVILLLLILLFLKQKTFDKRLVQANNVQTTQL